jgi:peptide/nickel transport system ATP-binding protein
MVKRPKLTVHNLQIRFEMFRDWHRVIDDLSFECGANQVLAVLGESGCGKSVIAKSIIRILDDQTSITGEIYLDDLDLLKLNEQQMAAIRGNRIAYIPQNPDLALNPVMRIKPQLIEPLMTHRLADRTQSVTAALQILEKLDFKNPSAIINMYPHQLSGGMKQRIMIAAAMLIQPEVIIADEPSKALDEVSREIIIEKLRKAKHILQAATLLITHDLDLAAKLSDTIAVMYAGEIVESSPTSSFFTEPFHPYSRALLQSSPEMGFWPITGSSPEPGHYPGGCRFHPRCIRRMPICEAQKPEMVDTDQGQVKCHLY